MKANGSIYVAFAAILIFGASIFTACSKDDDEEILGVDTTNRVDNYKDMESLVESLPFSQLQGVSVGNSQGNDAKTGVTVFFFPKASMASAVVLGGMARCIRPVFTMAMKNLPSGIGQMSTPLVCWPH